MKTTSFRSTVCALLTIVFVSGCASSGSLVGGTSAVPSQLSNRSTGLTMPSKAGSVLRSRAGYEKSWMTPAVKSVGSLIYVSNSIGTCIAIYAQDASRKQIGQLCDPLKSANAVAVDQQENVWVADFYGSQVVCFPRGKTKPSIVISDPGYNPAFLAVDDKQNVYVSNYQTTPAYTAGNISIYPKGSTKPSKVLTDSSIVNPYGVAVDKRHNVFIVSNNNSVGEFQISKSGSYEKYKTLIFNGGGAPAGLELEPNGQLLVADQDPIVGTSKIPLQAIQLYSPPKWKMRKNLWRHNGDKQRDDVFKREQTIGRYSQC